MQRRRWIETELVRQWRKAFGEPPAVMGDPHLMVELLRASQETGPPVAERDPLVRRV